MIIWEENIINPNNFIYADMSDDYLDINVYFKDSIGFTVSYNSKEETETNFNELNDMIYTFLKNYY